MNKSIILRFTAVFLVAISIFAAACGSSDKETYDAPGELELELPVSDEGPGVLLDVEELDLGSSVIGYRILYTSESLEGEAIGVSGYVATPSGTPPAGGWPLVAWAHGTTGMADICAPSLDVAGDALIWETLTSAGYAVVATDYEGLGTPGLHPYIVGRSESRGVFDSVRAVQNHDGELGDIEVTDDWVAWGHSQGGHTAMFVSQTWQDYAPELNLLGVIAGAPPSQFNLLYDSLIGGPFQGYIAMATAAYEASYPDVDLSTVLTDKAIELLPVLDQECTEGVFAAFNPLDPEELSKVDNPLAVEPFKTITDENDPSKLPPQAPLLIIHGEEDEQIPSVSSLLLVGQLCQLGGASPIQRLGYEGEGHESVVLVAADDMLGWMGDRFAGNPAPSDCS